MSKNSQKGFAHILLIVLLLLGVGLGVYLIGQKTQLFPWAASNPISGPITSPSPSTNPSPSTTSVTGTITAKPESCLFTGDGSCVVGVVYTVNASDQTITKVKIRETGEDLLGFKRSSNGSFSIKYPMVSARPKVTFDLYYGNSLLNSAVAQVETNPFTQKNITISPSVYATQSIKLSAQLLSERDLNTVASIDIRDLAGKSILSRTLQNQKFDANQSKTLTIEIEVPVETAEGNYKATFRVKNSVNNLVYIEFQQPLVIKKTTFNAYATTNISVVKPGNAIDLTANATASIDTSLRVLIEVVDSAGAKKFSKVFVNDFAANLPNSFTAPWITPKNLSSGVYTVKVYLQGVVSRKNYFINNNAAQFTVAP